LQLQSSLEINWKLELQSNPDNRITKELQRDKEREKEERKKRDLPEERLGETGDG
ncbi:hypothetical protein Tsubulata_001935, partial [Turnera subulata]